MDILKYYIIFAAEEQKYAKSDYRLSKRNNQNPIV